MKVIDSYVIKDLEFLQTRIFATHYRADFAHLLSKNPEKSFDFRLVHEVFLVSCIVNRLCHPGGYKSQQLCHCTIGDIWWGPVESGRSRRKQTILRGESRRSFEPKRTIFEPKRTIFTKADDPNFD